MKRIRGILGWELGRDESAEAWKWAVKLGAARAEASRHSADSLAGSDHSEPLGLFGERIVRCACYGLEPPGVLDGPDDGNDLPGLNVKTVPYYHDPLLMVPPRGRAPWPEDGFVLVATEGRPPRRVRVVGWAWVRDVEAAPIVGGEGTPCPHRACHLLRPEQLRLRLPPVLLDGTRLLAGLE